MDLGLISVADTTPVHLRHPVSGLLYSNENKALPCQITVCSPASRQAQDYKKKVLQEARALYKKKGASAGKDRTADEILEEQIDFLEAMTVNIENIELNGVPVTVENVRSLYEMPSLGWATDQVRAIVGDWDAFLSESPKKPAIMLAT